MDLLTVMHKSEVTWCIPHSEGRTWKSVSASLASELSCKMEVGVSTNLFMWTCLR
jgi:hypothetical protein